MSSLHNLRESKEEESWIDFSRQIGKRPGPTVGLARGNACRLQFVELLVRVTQQGRLCLDLVLSSVEVVPDLAYLLAGGMCCRQLGLDAL